MFLSQLMAVASIGSSKKLATNWLRAALGKEEIEVGMQKRSIDCALRKTLYVKLFWGQFGAKEKTENTGKNHDFNTA